MKGLWVINCNSIASGLKDTFSVKKDTINKIDFTFQMPKLVNGDYVVGVANSAAFFPASSCCEVLLLR